MNGSVRTLTRAVARPLSNGTSRFIPPLRSNGPFHPFQLPACRSYSSIPPPRRTTSNRYLYLSGGIVATLAVLAGGYYLTRPKRTGPEIHLKKGSARESAGIFTPTSEDYQNVYNAVATQLWEKDEYDDGSYGPVVLRLAWHASGTYDAATGTGGSNGATMRFDPEKSHGANNGLDNARDFLEPIKAQFPWISYSDLWTLAGVCAVQEMQGPVVPWRPGRKDRDESSCTPDGRLPDGSLEQNHIRRIFGRMGFSDQEMVALSGAHALGRCHVNRSGFEGPWTFSPTVLTNEFYRLLMQETWSWRDWSGQKQYQDATTKSLMMLPTDMALIQDSEFKKYVEKYAEDEKIFFHDFSDAVVKLFELGVPFRDGVERLRLVTLGEQEEAAEE